LKAYNKMQMLKKLIFFFILISIISCNRIINPSLMFKTGDNYQYASLQDTIVPEYKIEPNDRFTFTLYTNEGYKIIDLATLGGSSPGNNAGGTTSGTASGSSSIEYSVDRDGNARLPQLEKVYIKDYTVPEAEKMLEEKYSEYYIVPFVKIKITNKRVLIFPGEGGEGSVITLLNDNTSLIEALAMAGGIRSTGKAFNIKLIRGGIANPKIFHIDLSTIEGMKYADIVMQANDIIYVEPVKNTTSGILTQISPLLGILTAALSVYQISKGK
jgi:polysaccharide export outer membrane protein